MAGNKSHIIKPWVTEKAAGMAKSGQYVFIVSKSANSKQIKEELGKIYNVHVMRVNVLSKPDQSGRKKAIVTLKAGEKIDILPQ